MVSPKESDNEKSGSTGEIGSFDLGRRDLPAPAREASG